MQMSFLGSIGHLMAGSGLQERIEVVFTGNAVRNMLTGKALSRAVRGHMLVDASLNTILVAKAYHIPLPTKETDEPNGTQQVLIPRTMMLRQTNRSKALLMLHLT